MVRYGPLPDARKSVTARRHHFRIIGQLVPEESPVTREEPEAHKLVIENPAVSQRNEQARSGPPGKPPDLLSGSDVESRALVLETDVLGQRLRDDPRPAEAHAPGRVLAHQLVPGRSSRGGNGSSGLPVKESRIVRRVGVARLQVHGCARRSRDQVAERRHCH